MKASKISFHLVPTLLLLAFLLPASLAWAQAVTARQIRYNFKTYDVPGSAGTSAGTAVNGITINAIAGDYGDTSGNTHGFVMLANQHFATFDVPKMPYTAVNGINPFGCITGTYATVQDAVDANTDVHAFYWCGNAVITLDPPGSVRSQSGSLNALGQVVGEYRTSDEVRHGFLWTERWGFTSFNVANANTVPQGINDFGQIVGDYYEAGVYYDGTPIPLFQGFLLTGNKYTTIAPPGAAVAIAEGINDAGVIVGVYLDPELNEHGFVYSKGEYLTVDVPQSNGNGTEINSINNQGQIVGFYYDANGYNHGFIGTPQP